jgi:hypothetical protein
MLHARLTIARSPIGVLVNRFAQASQQDVDFGCGVAGAIRIDLDAQFVRHFDKRSELPTGARRSASVARSAASNVVFPRRRRN